MPADTPTIVNRAAPTTTTTHNSPHDAAGDNPLNEDERLGDDNVSAPQSNLHARRSSDESVSSYGSSTSTSSSASLVEEELRRRLEARPWPLAKWVAEHAALAFGECVMFHTLF